LFLFVVLSAMEKTERNGLLACGACTPTPLPLAAGLLTQALMELNEPPLHLAAKQPDGGLILRVEVPVYASGPQMALLLDWLGAQRSLFPRALFASRDGHVQLTGAGAAHLHCVSHSSAPSSCKDEHLPPEVMAPTHETIRYIGGARFDSSDQEAPGISSEWGAFGSSYWFLPRVELSTLRSSASAGSLAATDGSETASSTGSNSIKICSNSGLDGAGRLVTACFAVQLRWMEAGGSSAWAAERSLAVEALARVRPPGGRRPLPGVVSRRSDAVSQEDFEEHVRVALESFKSGELEKVVLARRVLLELTLPIESVDVLLQVVDGQKRSYIFLLEPCEGTAFVSLTPERLCKVEGRDIWTEAVAGTWPLAELSRVGEAALLASSAKHSSEHRLVVDYLCERLKKISDNVKVCETHILKLKDLVHIKQSYHALAVGFDSSNNLADTDKKVPDGGLPAWFCEHVSPTPAVCGLPMSTARSFIRKAEPWDRGFYAGPCGIVGARGADLIVAIRSALLHGGRKLHVYAGAGIIPGSNPTEEFDEISLKMKQFTERFTLASSGPKRIVELASLPNMNTLWSTLVVEELVRGGVRDFVICAGSRSTPLVIAVARHPNAKYVMNHDERGAAFFALGWAKAIRAPVAVIVTSGTAVANLLPGVVEASQSQVPLLLLTADRPHELRETGANQTIMQPGIFSSYVRWMKDFPPPSVEYPAHALLSDIDLAVSRASGHLASHPGPVHLNFCFRENLAPDAGPVRGAPQRDSAWNSSYVDTAELCQWMESCQPRSCYVSPVQSLARCDVVEELVGLASSGTGRIVILVGSLSTTEDMLLAEDVGRRLGGAVFADITSGLRQRPGTIHHADLLLNCSMLAGDLMQLDAIVHLGGPICSARLGAFAKAAAPRLYVRVGPAPVRLDPEHNVTHHLPCSLSALAKALASSGLVARDAPPFWKKLSEVAADEVKSFLSSSNGLTEPFVAVSVSRLLYPGSSLHISSSMPIRDLDGYARPCPEASLAPSLPPMANRGAAGIDGVISTAVGYCRGSELPGTLVIGDTAALHDLNALQQLTGPDAPTLTVVIVNNGGGGIFSFLPIAAHRETFSPCFDAPHSTDFAAACSAFGIPFVCCITAEDFEAEYLRTQRPGVRGPCVIEARVELSREDNAALHRSIGRAVAARARDWLLSNVCLGWTRLGRSVELFAEEGLENQAEAVEPSKSEGPAGSAGSASKVPIVLLHGWLGEKGDWSEVSRHLIEAGHEVLAVDLPGHGASEAGGEQDSWEAAAFFSLPAAVEALATLLDQLRIRSAVLVGYSLGGRVAMAFAATYPARVRGLVALSANPGLKLVAEQCCRRSGDAALAARVAALRASGEPTTGSASDDIDAFLREWYRAPLWADLASRRPEVYASMLRRRRLNPRLAALTLRGLSLGRQPDFRASLAKQSSKFCYVHGTLDGKFAALGKDLEHEGFRVLSLPDVAHAIVEECPDAVAKLCLEFLQGLGAEASLPSSLAPSSGASSLRLTAAWSRPMELPLKTPLLLSRGDPMPNRQGLLVVLESKESGIAGLGEVSPLPMFHRESLAEATTQLAQVLEAWSATPPMVPFSLARLDGGMTKWLEQACPDVGPLLPSVRAGLEMSLLHLIGRATKAPHLASEAAAARGLCCISEVGINALVAREEDLGGLSCGAPVVKVKVGKDPAEDACRVNKLAEALRHRLGPRGRLRLDANQAWTVPQAALFFKGLSDVALQVTEYIEEPILGTNGSASFLSAWEDLASQTEHCLRIAVDESLTEKSVCPDDLVSCKVSFGALVLKPALQGLEQTMELGALAVKIGAQPVISSAFESGVALCHFAILAASMAPSPWAASTGVSAFHGLGTFTRIAEDALCPPFADLACRCGREWRVNLLECQAALDRTVDSLVAQGCGRCRAE